MAFRKRSGSFKKCNLTETELALHAPLWLEKLSQLQKDSTLHPALLCAELLFHILQTLRPEDWKGQKRKVPLELPGALQIFAQHSLRGVPESVNRALVEWFLGRFPLKLYFYKPSSEEVLRLQIQGQRCVTIFSEPEQWLRFHDGRDAYSFILHDLIHADHFFAKPDWQEGQIQFYRHCWQLWNSVEFRDLLNQDQKFSEQFEYAFSDMNSHPQHLHQYLQAIHTQALERATAG